MSNQKEKPDLLSMFPDEMRAFFKENGQPAYRADQAAAHLVRGQGIEEMHTLPRTLRTFLAENALCRLPRIAEKQVSAKDGTVKYLMRLSDGECVESVLMRYKYGNSLCISSQAGCRMGCRFCASTLAGRVRNLYASEMLGQVIMAGADTGERVSHIVMMGIGVPLDNYEETVRFLRLASHPALLNIGLRHISLSTCGLVPAIRRLSTEGLPITLSISLHASDNEARSRIMPINNTYPIEELLSACADWYRTTGRRISFEYTLLAGENDSEAHAAALAALLHRHLDAVKAPLHVNLIRVNQVEETSFREGTRESAAHFAEALGRRGVNATVRRRLGRDVDAACGQLRRRRQKEAEGQIER